MSKRDNPPSEEETETSEHTTHSDSIPPDRLNRDELYDEIIDIANLPEKGTTGSYPMRKKHLVGLVQYLRRTEEN